MTPENIIAGGGSAGLILFLFFVVRELWLDHKRKDATTERERDDALALAKSAVEGTAKISEGLARLTNLVERQASRRRVYDGDGNGQTARSDRPTGPRSG